MNWQYITANWKTSVAGFLVAITVLAPILQKVDWHHLNINDGIGLVGACAVALLGLYARDHNGPPPNPNKEPQL